MSLVDLIVNALSVVKFMMIIQSFKIPLRALELINKTDSDRERMLLSRIGMFFDCPVCVSVIASVLVLCLYTFGLQFINLILGLSIIGVIINKRFIRDSVD